MRTETHVCTRYPRRATATALPRTCVLGLGSCGARPLPARPPDVRTPERCMASDAGGSLKAAARSLGWRRLLLPVEPPQLQPARHLRVEGEAVPVGARWPRPADGRAARRPSGRRSLSLRCSEATRGPPFRNPVVTVEAAAASILVAPSLARRGAAARRSARAAGGSTAQHARGTARRGPCAASRPSSCAGRRGRG